VHVGEHSGDTLGERCDEPTRQRLLALGHDHERSAHPEFVDDPGELSLCHAEPEDHSDRQGVVLEIEQCSRRLLSRT
jgi:hypothetical protein